MRKQLLFELEVEVEEPMVGTYAFKTVTQTTRLYAYSFDDAYHAFRENHRYIIKSIKEVEEGRNK
ncbi:hypothetical protein [Enterococcus phage vB_EfaH_149]|uniref:Uncharacterized protein n=1 Tax=Enterococcus phage vB_EfaH_149 TaxID=2730535 RepID=A0ACA9ATS1_9CAUD|nr:hypothetical protein [Enterococcus phage vB_EfaH_149]